jgi:hypothetical protein
MSSFIDDFAPTLGWIALGAAISVATYVWISTNIFRTLLAKRRDRSAEPDVYRQLKALRSQGIVDADIDLFIAVFENDVDQLKNALDRGANVNVTDTEVLSRYTTPGLTSPTL